ncbi:hypothetical protein DIPPA_15469 [Diplonema papillatum]|nr:hypothetical protein DIPPA_15469 [Diplonema papillatum]
MLCEESACGDSPPQQPLGEDAGGSSCGDPPPPPPQQVLCEEAPEFCGGAASPVPSGHSATPSRPGRCTPGSSLPRSREGSSCGDPPPPSQVLCEEAPEFCGGAASPVPSGRSAPPSRPGRCTPGSSLPRSRTSRNAARTTRDRVYPVGLSPASRSRFHARSAGASVLCACSSPSYMLRSGDSPAARHSRKKATAPSGSRSCAWARRMFLATPVSNATPNTRCASSQCPRVHSGATCELARIRRRRVARVGGTLSSRISFASPTTAEYAFHCVNLSTNAANECFRTAAPRR